MNSKYDETVEEIGGFIGSFIGLDVRSIFFGIIFGWDRTYALKFGIGCDPIKIEPSQMYAI